MKCRFVLPEQMSRVRCSAVPGLHSLHAPFLFLPAGELGWGKGLGPSWPWLRYVILFCEFYVFSWYMQFGAVLFPVALRGLVVLIIFSYYMQF